MQPTGEVLSVLSGSGWWSRLSGVDEEVDKGCADVYSTSNRLYGQILCQEAAGPRRR